MRHNVSGYKLNRDGEHRRALLRNLAAALFQHGQITTTPAKAKAVQPLVERLITTARKGDVNSRRRVIAALRDRKLVTVDKETGDPLYETREDGGDKTLVQKLFTEIAPRYANRAGGYTRIIKTSRHRIGDGTSLVVLQLVGAEDENAPRVKGRYSRRRQAQDKRTAFAAKLRKGEKAEAPAAEAPKAE
jgi:large subunit ribosomal protein L17